MKYNVKKKVGLCIFHLILVGILIDFDMSICPKNTLSVCDSYLSTDSQQL